MDRTNGYPVLPLFSLDTENGPYTVIDKTASNVYSAYIGTWFAGKTLGEVDGFDLNADSNAYWDRLFRGSQGSTETVLSRLTSHRNSLPHTSVPTNVHGNDIETLQHTCAIGAGSSSRKKHFLV